MRSIVKVIIRIILIVVFLQMITSLVNYSNTIWNILPRILAIDFHSYVYILVGVAVVGTIILGIFWWKTDWLVKVLVGNISEDSFEISTNNFDFLHVVMRIIGIYLVAITIPQLIGLIGYRFSFPPEYTEYIVNQAHAVWLKELLIVVFTLIIGLALIFIGYKVINYIRSFWNTASLSGKKPDSEDT